jgi:hypothetical protein
LVTEKKSLDIPGLRLLWTVPLWLKLRTIKKNHSPG